MRARAGRGGLRRDERAGGERPERQRRVEIVVPGLPGEQDDHAELTRDDGQQYRFRPGARARGHETRETEPHDARDHECRAAGDGAPWLRRIGPLPERRRHAHLEQCDRPETREDVRQRSTRRQRREPRIGAGVGERRIRGGKAGDDQAQQGGTDCPGGGPPHGDEQRRRDGPRGHREVQLHCDAERRAERAETPRRWRSRQEPQQQTAVGGKAAGAHAIRVSMTATREVAKTASATSAECVPPPAACQPPHPDERRDAEPRRKR